MEFCSFSQLLSSIKTAKAYSKKIATTHHIVEGRADARCSRQTLHQRVGAIRDVRSADERRRWVCSEQIAIGGLRHSKFARCPSTLGVCEPLVAVQSRQPPQGLQIG